MTSPPQGRETGRGGLVAVSIALVLASAYAQQAPARFLKPRSRAVKTSALLLRNEKGPGFFRNWGVRGGAEHEDMGELGDDGSIVDSTLNRNIFQGSSMAYDFNKLDNMNPIAPMDRLHAALGSASEGGHNMNPVYVPAYLNPEAFPNTHGPGCNCSMAIEEDETIECTCGEEGDPKERNHYTWLKESPVLGTNNFTLEPADISYRSGNYWSPKTRDGLVAPADALPPNRFPNQARGDHIWPLPATARADRLGIKFARYMDQVQDRYEECDTVSKKCTVQCKPGDEVTAAIGNVVFNAKVVKTYVGNAVEITFSPDAAKTAKETASCPLEAVCSAFRFCKSPDLPHCLHQKDKDTKNWAGMLVRKHQCPEGSKVCKSVSQVVMATSLKKGDKACRAAAR